MKMRDEALRLIEKDAQAFQELMAQFKKGKKAAELGSYFEKCTKAPLRLCEIAGEGFDIAQTQEKLTHRFLLSDLEESRLLLEAGWKAARLNVEINLNGMKDVNRVASIRKAVKDTW
jgi:formiminotetrahydrofolate cyclodeaminase